MHQAVAVEKVTDHKTAGAPTPACHPVGDAPNSQEQVVSFTSHAVAAMEAEIDAMALEHLIDASPTETELEANLAACRIRIVDMQQEVARLTACLVESDWAPKRCADIIKSEMYRSWAIAHNKRTTLSADIETRTKQLESATMV